MKPFSYTAQPAAAAAPPSTGGGGFPQMSPVVVDSYASKIAPLPFHHSPSAGGISHVTAPKSPQMLQQPQPFQQQQQQQLVQQQQQLQSSSSSSYQESTFKSTSSSSTSFESSSAAGAAAGGSKVTWPPSDIVPSPTPPQQQKQQQQQPKFRQQHVPYQPVASLLIQPAQQQQQQQPKFSPVQAPPTQPQQQQQFTAPFQAAPPPQQQVQPIQFTPLILQQPQQQPMFSATAAAPAPSAAGTKPLPSFPIAPAPGPSAYNTASRNTTTSATLASRISRGILTHPSGGGGGPRVAVCGGCQKQIRGPFVTAGLKFYCPEHFKCGNGSCGRDLMEVGFVEEGAALYCEFCWEAHIAPPCGKCGKRIKYECIKAIGRDFHKECFTCKQCNRQFGNDPFFLEDGEPFCQADWNEMFTTKCHGCGFPIEAGDRWVEAMNNNYHSQCFNCSACKKNLEGQSFFAKAGRPFCKSHAR